MPIHDHRTSDGRPTDGSGACWRCGNYAGLSDADPTLAMCRYLGETGAWYWPLRGCNAWRRAADAAQPITWRPARYQDPKDGRYDPLALPEFEPILERSKPDPEPRRGTSDHGEWLIRQEMRAGRELDKLLGRLRRSEAPLRGAVPPEAR